MSNNTPPPPTSDSAGVAPLGTNWPHLSHYLNQLIQSTSQISGATHSTTLLQPPQHPLSVSSSGSDGSDSDDANEKDVRKEEDPAKVAEGSKEVDDSGVRSDSGEKTLSLEQISRKTIGGPSIDKEELLRRVVDLLDNEREEEVKPLLKEKLPGLEKVRLQSRKDLVLRQAHSSYGGPCQDDNLLDQICLDLMHKHKGQKGMQCIPGMATHVLISPPFLATQTMSNTSHINHPLRRAVSARHPPSHTPLLFDRSRRRAFRHFERTLRSDDRTRLLPGGSRAAERRLQLRLNQAHPLVEGLSTLEQVSRHPRALTRRFRVARRCRLLDY
jgi:hypothetical protein